MSKYDYRWLGVQGDARLKAHAYQECHVKPLCGTSKTLDLYLRPAEKTHKRCKSCRYQLSKSSKFVEHRNLVTFSLRKFLLAEELRAELLDLEQAD